MRRISLLLTFLISSIVLFAFAIGIASAGTQEITYTVSITSLSCEEVSFDYVNDQQNSGGSDFASVSVSVDGSVVFSNAEAGSPFEDSLTVGLSLAPRPQPYLVTVEVTAPGTGSDAASIVCGQTAQPIQTGRICFGPGAVAATLFFDGNTIDVYAIDPNDNGELVMSFSQDYLKTLPVDGQARLLGDSDVHIAIELWRNANGFYRLLAGPDAEDKYFECTFGGACSFERSWISAANAPGDEVVPVCEEPEQQPTQRPTLVPTSLPS